MDSLIILAVYGFGVYILAKYIIPYIWTNILKPIGKMAYIILIFGVGILFFVSLGVFQQEGLPEEVQVFIAVIVGISAGVKWAKKKI